MRTWAFESMVRKGMVEEGPPEAEGAQDSE